MKHVRLLLQILLPLAVLLAGGWLAWVVASRHQEPVVAPTTARGPIVRTQVAAATDLRIDVDTQGTVEPFRTVELSSQVGGRILAVSPALRAGGFFAPDEVLVEIDPADFELYVVQQEAAVARAELRVLQERAEADAAVRAWKQLEGEAAADPLVTRGPQILDAEKSLAAARAMLERSRLDLQRTKVKAPFAGRVRSAFSEVGQMVQPGQHLAIVTDVAVVEVRLPIPAADAAFLDLPMDFLGKDHGGSSAGVRLRTEFAGRACEWTGTVVRTEGEIDRRTRQLTVVARVDDPYAPSNPAGRPPLLVGMFVQARIQGRVFSGVITLPRAALSFGDHVWIVDAEQRLRRRDVQVLREQADRIVVSSGLAAGDLVCITSLETPTDGMPVRLVDAPTNGTTAEGK